MQKRKHVVSRSTFQKRKYRENAVGIRYHIHVEVVTEEVEFPMGVQIRIVAFAVTGRTDFHHTIVDTFFSLQLSAVDRSTVTDKS